MSSIDNRQPGDPIPFPKDPKPSNILDRSIEVSRSALSVGVVTVLACVGALNIVGVDSSENTVATLSGEAFLLHNPRITEHQEYFAVRYPEETIENIISDLDDLVGTLNSKNIIKSTTGNYYRTSLSAGNDIKGEISISQNKNGSIDLVCIDIEHKSGAFTSFKLTNTNPKNVHSSKFESISMESRDADGTGAPLEFNPLRFNPSDSGLDVVNQGEVYRTSSQSNRDLFRICKAIANAA